MTILSNVSRIFNTPLSNLHPIAQSLLRLGILLAIHGLRRLRHPAARVTRIVLKDVRDMPPETTLKDVVDAELPKLDRALRVLAKTRKKLEYVRIALEEWRASSQGNATT